MMFFKNNVENLRENSELLFVNNETQKTWGKWIFFVDNSENLKEKLQYFLLIMWKAWGKKVGYVKPKVI
jgi:hypothetical protein